jgi:hypothetical protein
MLLHMLLTHWMVDWARYINQPEPNLTGHSVTVKADDQRIKDMRERAARTFTPELAALMQVTSCPTIEACRPPCSAKRESTSILAWMSASSFQFSHTASQKCNDKADRK